MWCRIIVSRIWAAWRSNCQSMWAAWLGNCQFIWAAWLGTASPFGQLGLAMPVHLGSLAWQLPVHLGSLAWQLPVHLGSLAWHWQSIWAANLGNSIWAAWPGNCQSIWAAWLDANLAFPAISHLVFFLASHAHFLSRIFISHFLFRISHFLSHLEFYLAFSIAHLIFYLAFAISHLAFSMSYVTCFACPFRASVWLRPLFSGMSNFRHSLLCPLRHVRIPWGWGVGKSEHQTRRWMVTIALFYHRHPCFISYNRHLRVFSWSTKCKLILLKVVIQN